MRVVLASVVALALVAAACSSGSGEAATETTPVSPSTVSTTTTLPAATTTTTNPGPLSGGSITVLLASDPTPIAGWTPWDDVCAWACRNVLDHVLETLTVVLPNGSIEPWLAESVEPDESLTTWTVRLRPGITFTDGTTLTAAGVKDGLDKFLKGGDVSGGHYRDSRLVTVQAPDELTLVFGLSDPNAGFPAALAGPVGRVFSVMAADSNPNSFAAAPIGTGPFVFTSWVAGQPVELQANPNYWRKAPDGSSLPYLDELRFEQVADETERLDRLLAGEAEAIQTRVTETIDRARSAANDLTVLSHFDDNVGAIVFNTLRAPLDDVRVRRGLALATNQAALLDAVNMNVLPATQWWAPDSIWFSAQVAQRWATSDLETARSLLNEYISDPERSDELPQGTPVQVRIQCTDDAALTQLVAELKQQLEATGLVAVMPEVVSRTGLIQRVTGSVADRPSFSGDFTATCWRVGGESDPWVLLEAALGPVRTSPLNIANLHTEPLNTLVDLVQTGATLAERRAAVEQIMLAFASEVPQLYLGYAQSAVMVAAEVQGALEWSLPNGGQVSGQRLGVGRYTEFWVRDE